MRNNRRPNALKLLGWCSAVLSTLNLINQLSPVVISGTLNEWLNAYVLFVDRVSTFLFGWINISWISVSSTENHFLVIASVLVMTFHRAQVKFETDKGEPWISAFISSFFVSQIWLLAYVLLALLFSEQLSSWLIGIGIILLCRFYLKGEDRMDGLADRKIIFKELTAVATSLVLIIVLNYTVFS
jgi:hypothetical protein